MAEGCVPPCRAAPFRYSADSIHPTTEAVGFLLVFCKAAPPALELRLSEAILVDGEAACRAFLRGIRGLDRLVPQAAFVQLGPQTVFQKADLSGPQAAVHQAAFEAHVFDGEAFQGDRRAVGKCFQALVERLSDAVADGRIRLWVVE